MTNDSVVVETIKSEVMQIKNKSKGLFIYNQKKSSQGLSWLCDSEACFCQIEGDLPLYFTLNIKAHQPACF